MPYSLDPDQARHFVGHVQSPNCLQSLHTIRQNLKNILMAFLCNERSDWITSKFETVCPAIHCRKIDIIN